MDKKDKKFTIFQRLDNAINNDWVAKQAQANIRSYNMANNKQVLFKTKDKGEYDAKLQQLRQDKYLSNMWHATNDVLAGENINGASRLALMYRDVELMDGMPEIGTALDIIAEESTLPDDRGNVVNVYSSSERVKTILEDLFVNRLNLSVQAAMVIRGIAKYGNMYYLLNIDSDDGVKEWRQLPVEEMQRIESDIDVATGMQIVPMNTVNFNVQSSGDEDKATPVRFVWMNGDQQRPFFSWQVAHFRLLTDNSFLPYGTSFLHKARRHWRQLSIMEDMMLIYRLERSIERRVFKIYVGNIDDADVPAFMDEIANKFKRTVITDPVTGQLDLRKNLMSVSDDYFIPTRDPSASSPIESLQGASNLTALDDIKYVQNKVLCALRIPLAFLSFDKEGGGGDGGNLAMKDIRFVRTVNRIQQAFLEELTKIATTHLYLLGFEDDLRNFTLTMNNPSTQAEQLEVETLGKKIETIRNAVTDAGNGMPMMSMQRALKTVMKWSEKDIKENLQELRLEKALAKELEKTDQIIKRTTLFDEVDRIYGEPNAKYQDEEGSQEGEQGGEPMGGGGGGGGLGGGLDLGGGDEGDMGEEGEVPMEDAGGADAQASGGAPEGGDEGGGAPAPPTSEAREKQPVLTESLNRLFDKNKKIGAITNSAPIYDKDFAVKELTESINKYFEKAKERSNG